MNEKISLQQIYVFNRKTNEMSILMDKIEATVNKVPQTESITSISPFIVRYGGDGLFSKYYAYSVINGFEYNHYSGFKQWHNSSKLLWFVDDNGCLTSINIISNAKEYHGKYSDIEYRSSYIQLTKNTGEKQYLNYYGHPLSKEDIYEQSTFLDFLRDIF